MSRRELLTRYKNFFGERETSEILKVKDKIRKDQYVRVNRSLCEIEDVEKFLKGNRVKYSRTFLPNCIKIEKSFFNLSSSLPSLTGEIYLQDIASQIPVNCIDYSNFSGKVRVLDMAASPGSKTTQIADMLTLNGIEFEMIALEPEKKRLQKLINNIQKQGFRGIEIFNVRGEEFESKEKFDIILLDAPCSGNLAGDSDWLEKRNVEGIRKMAELQKKLLRKASELLREGGVLIYSTCSMEPEEDEENVEWILRNCGLRTFRPKLEFPFDVRPLRKQDSYRFMPHKAQMQGFFVCCLTKK